MLMAASHRTPVDGVRLMCTVPAEPSVHAFGSVRDVRDAVEVQSRRALALAAAAGVEVPLERRRVEDLVQEVLGGI